jgi:hypothetical protein
MRSIKIIKSFLFVSTLLFFINLCSTPLISSALSMNQSASLTISTVPNVFFIEAPNNLTLPQSFSHENQENIVYKAFSPDDINNKIKIVDLRNSGGFQIDMTVSNFEAGTNSISYANLGMVTLSGVGNTESVAYESGNNPAGTDSGTVSSPLFCAFPSQSSILENCASFTTPTGIGNESNPILLVDAPTVTGRTGTYYIGLGLKLTIPRSIPPGNYKSVFTLTILPT